MRDDESELACPICRRPGWGDCCYLYAKAVERARTRAELPVLPVMLCNSCGRVGSMDDRQWIYLTGADKVICPFCRTALLMAYKLSKGKVPASAAPFFLALKQSQPAGDVAAVERSKQ